MITSQKAHLARTYPNAQYAAVLDIDDTALKVTGQKRVRRMNAIWMLYQFLVNAGITVFFVTARWDATMDYTTRQLMTHGYTDWKHVYLRASNHDMNRTDDFGKYKREAREDVRKQGYVVLVNCGDQWYDFFVKPPPQISSLDSTKCHVFANPEEGNLLCVKMPFA